jgi:hypothetical protein
MVRLTSRPLAFTLVALGALISGAQAFPLDGAARPRHGFPSLRANGFGVIDPGECRLVRQQIIDNSYRVHDRWNKICD